MGAFASSVTASGANFNHHGPMSSFPSLIGILLVVLAAGTVALATVRRGNRLLAGLFLALLGGSGLGSCLARLHFRRQFSWEILVAAIVFLGVLSWGLRSMLAGAAGCGYGRRAGYLLAEFVLPAFFLWLWSHFTRGFETRYLALALMASGVVAAALVSIKPARRRQDAPKTGSWRLAVWGLLASVVLVAGVQQGQAALERHRIAQARAALAASPAVPADLPYPKLFFQKGVNFTAEYPDPYDSEGARRMLEQLPKYGVNAIALVPYGWSRPGSTTIRVNTGMNSWENDLGLEILARLAHSFHMKVMLKPGVWGVTNPGFSSAADRALWFEQYGDFIDHYARLATRMHADIFSVGGEFGNLSAYDAEWRKLIARVRTLYPGPLVYAANWGPEFEHLTFWDALDYIGLQEYYPLPDDLSTAALLAKVEAVENRYQRPVIFTEAGFPSVAHANRQPWNGSQPPVISLEEQARCYQSIFRTFYDKPWFEGLYWWQVGTNGTGGPRNASFTPWGKPAMNVVARYYREDGR